MAKWRKPIDPTDEYLYLHPDTQRWGTIAARGAELRLKRTIVYSWSDHNTNQIERLQDTQWVPVTAAEYSALTPLQQGHQWTYQPVQRDDGTIMVAVTMARIADEHLVSFTPLNPAYVMRSNYTLELSEETWQRVAKRALAFGVDLIDLAVNMATTEEAFVAARAAWEQLTALHQRAIALVDGITPDGLLEMESIIEQARPLNAQYLSQRSTVVSAAYAFAREPGRLPEKAQVQSWQQQLADTTSISAIIALSKAAAVEQSLALRTASPRERQAGLIAELLNDFYGKRLAEASGEEIILYDVTGRAAAVIAKGNLHAYERRV